jgi:hypothetical protein
MTEQLNTSLINEGMQRIYDYWTSRRHDGRLPRREDIDPGELSDLLPNIFLVDVEEAPRRYRVRLAGTEVVACFGVDMTGKTIDQYDLADERASVLEQYDLVVATREPSYKRHEFWTAAYEHHLNYERLLLPLSSDGDHIDKMLGCTFVLPFKAEALAPQ